MSLAQIRSGTHGAAHRRALTLVGPPFTDTFDTALDTANRWKGTTYSVSVVGGRLRVPCLSSGPQASTAAVFDLNSYDVWVQLPTVPSPGTGTKQTQLIIKSGSNSAAFNITGSTLGISMSLTGQSNTSVTYNSTNHQWLRFRMSGGNLLWQSSPDNITWTTLRTFAAPTWITGGLVAVVLTSSFYGSETTDTYAEFDNFCVAA